MMGVRVSLRSVLISLCTAVTLATLYWVQCLPPSRPSLPITNTVSEPLSQACGLKDIECRINGDYTVKCKQDSDNVYMPFTFLHKYFEVYGKIVTAKNNENEHFEWSHSYGKIYHPKKKYDPTGTFTTFENYNVEVRDRVKCISGTEGVPVSTQWDPKGFYYPTQIAQYGLAHYSKNLTEPEPKKTVLEDGEKVHGSWFVSQDASISRLFEQSVQSNVLKFETASDVASKVWLQMDMLNDFVLGLDLFFRPNSSLTVVLQHKEKKETFYLHYETNSNLISAQGEHVHYGIGSEQKWRRLTRDLIVDMQKGWALLDRPKRKSPKNKYKLTSLLLSGSGYIDALSLSSTEHMTFALNAADWLVKRQRGGGGWPVPARRRIAQGVAELQPYWHSAMSQGHAISLLSRIYYKTGDQRYLDAARKALFVLDVSSQSGGVKAMWMDKYVWYEEYPTTPPLFVLNGFIYTLLGLYDLHMIEGENSISKAKALFDEGMTSLKKLLPLFDTGSGSFYDLRHFTLGVSPNIARWDYHATHVNQLFLLAGLDKDSVLINTAKRWEGYMKGKRAAHN